MFPNIRDKFPLIWIRFFLSYLSRRVLVELRISAWPFLAAARLDVVISPAQGEFAYIRPEQKNAFGPLGDIPEIAGHLSPCIALITGP
jgi:hypothetical protein